jgi:hypothetical protein
MNKIKKSAVLVLLLLGSLCCEKNDNELPCVEDPVITNPCHFEKEVSADFFLTEEITLKVETEKTRQGNIFLFAREKNALKYTWTIEGETFTAGDSLYWDARFWNSGDGLDVQLVVEKAPNLICYPDDDGVDTVKKYFEFVNRCEVAIVGSYRGVWENTTDSFDVAFDVYNYTGHPEDECYYFSVDNMDKKGGYCFGVDAWVQNRYFRIYDCCSPCSSPNGVASYTQDGKFFMEYTLNTEGKKYRFNGRKLN